MINEKRYDEYRRGTGTLSDSELTEFINHFECLCELLQPLGLLFFLSWKEAYKVLGDLKSMKEARRKNK